MNSLYVLLVAVADKHDYEQFATVCVSEMQLQGRTYLCKKLDLGSKVAMVRSADLKYYTKTRDFTDVHVVGGHTAYPVRVSTSAFVKTHPLFAIL